MFKQSDSAERDQELLSAYLDNQLAPAERARLEARLAAEPALRAELEGLRQTVQAVRTLPAARPPRNFTLDPRRYARRTTPLGLAYPVLRLATTAAVLLFAALFVGRAVTSLTFMGAAPMAPAPREAAVPTEAAGNMQVMATEEAAEQPPAGAETPLLGEAAPTAAPPAATVAPETDRVEATPPAVPAGPLGAATPTPGVETYATPQVPKAAETATAVTGVPTEAPGGAAATGASPEAPRGPATVPGAADQSTAQGAVPTTSPPAHALPTATPAPEPGALQVDFWSLVTYAAGAIALALLVLTVVARIQRG